MKHLYPRQSNDHPAHWALQPILTFSSMTWPVGISRSHPHPLCVQSTGRGVPLGSVMYPLTWGLTKIQNSSARQVLLMARVMGKIWLDKKYLLSPKPLNVLAHYAHTCGSPSHIRTMVLKSKHNQFQNFQSDPLKHSQKHVREEKKA